MLLKACLNGSREPGDHPALPISPEDLAGDARRAVEAGAGALHFHPRRSDGSEALDAKTVGDAVGTVRDVCPNAPAGVSTGAWIEPDLERRLEFIRGWGSLPEEARPDFASVNLSEAGAVEVCGALLDAGVGVEAGLWSAEDARLLLESGLADRCTRLLIELVKDRTADEARATARRVEEVLDAGGAGTEVIDLSELKERRDRIEEHSQMLKRRLSEIREKRADREQEIRLVERLEQFSESVRDSLEVELPRFRGQVVSTPQPLLPL